MLEERFAQHDKIPGDKYVNPAADYEMTTRDYILRPAADGNSGAFTITLPSVAEARGRTYSIVVRSADATNTVTIQDRDDSEMWCGDITFIVSGGVLLYSDGLRWFAMYPGYGVLSTKVTLTSAQVKALAATPQTLVPVLGATKLIEFLSATLFLGYGGTNVFTETADNLAIKYTDDSGVAVSDTIEMTGFIDQTADTFTRGVPVKDAIVAATGNVGQALVLDNIDDEIAGNAEGDNTLTIWTLFRIIETG